MTDAAAVAAATPPPPRRRLRAWHIVVAAGLLAVALLVAVVAWGGSRINQAADDPESTSKTGAGAVAQLLRNHGVSISVERRHLPEADLRGRTLVIANRDNLSEADIDQLARREPARIVILGATQWQALRVQQPQSSDPVCLDAYATRAGSVRADVAMIPSGTGVVGCYPMNERYAYLIEQRFGTPVYHLGSIAENQFLGDQGNAALALGVAGSTPDVVWLMAQPAPLPATHGAARPGGGDRTPLFLPPWAGVALPMIVVAAVVVGVWRGRRFGPILSERLPVVVRASETTEGHGRLYHRLHAVDTAAAALRNATIERLQRRFGTSDPARIAELVGDVTSLSTQHVAQALNGPPPASEEDLILLKRTLDDIERKARHP